MGGQVATRALLSGVFPRICKDGRWAPKERKKQVPADGQCIFSRTVVVAGGGARMPAALGPREDFVLGSSEGDDREAADAYERGVGEQFLGFDFG